MDNVAELLLRRCPPATLITYFESDGLLVPYRSETRLYETLVNDVKPVNSDYFKRVLKGFTDLLDRTAGSLAEDVYETWEWVYEEYVTTLGVAQSPEEAELDIIMYKFNDQCKVNIAEKPRVIGQGSTGNRTWEASVYLVHYLLEHPELVPGDAKRVIELGAGTGVVSLAYQQVFPFSEELLVTDGDEDIARRKLPQNFALNEIASGVSVKRLQWEAASGQAGHEEYDLVLGSDLTYDDRILEPLSSALEQLLVAASRNYALIAATVRNPRTTELFEETLAQHALQYEVMPASDAVTRACESTLFKPLVAPVAIYKIYKNKV